MRDLGHGGRAVEVMPHPAWWLRVREPGVIIASTSVLWLVLIVLGVTSLINPPSTITHEVGPEVAKVWAWGLVGGAVLGFGGCLSAWWWIERTGITVTATALMVWLVTVPSSPATPPGIRWALAELIVAMLVVLGIRWIRVSGLQVDPTRGRRRNVH